MSKVKIVQDPEKLMAVEVLAAEIKAIADGIKKLRSGRMNDKCLYLLIQHAALTYDRGRKVGITEVRTVLQGIESLEKEYLKKV